jgi:hypothetical protein
LIETPIDQEEASNSVIYQFRIQYVLIKDTIPECFEKSLIKIIYLVSLLSHLEVEDKILGLNTKEERFESLRKEF